ncbi:MAG: substrate-binding domain-containing protein [Lachnospiraceae bacterium]|nr:substrate-binding domain-containing protein [Lachnospiraceae bacterium]
MNNIKRAVTWIITGMLMTAILGGCGSATAGSAASSGMKVLYIDSDLDDTFRATLHQAVENASAGEGAQVTTKICGYDIQAQVAAIATAKEEGYGAVIVRLSDASIALQMKVAADGLPIVFVNNQPSAEQLKEDQYIYVASNEAQAGEYQVDYVLQKLNHPSSLDVVILEGEKGHSATNGRTKAVKAALADAGVKVNYVFVDFANWSTEEAEAKMDLFFRTGQNVDVVFSNNDSMALGAVASVISHGYDPAKLPVVGVDATTDGCASIKAGEMQFTVLQDASAQGAAAIKAAATLARGGSIADIEGATEDRRYIWVPFTPVDASNVASVQ